MALSHNDTDVLVVGGGPVGLVAGAELARRGVRVRVIDKLAQPTDQSRAIAVHARSLDMFDRMGIVDELLSTGIKATAMQLYAGHRKLFRVPLGGVDSAFPFTLTTAQTETERVLDKHLQTLGVSVDRGVELVALNQDADAVHLTLRREDGSTEQVSASWVIGADGGHSTVRKMVGTKLAGSFVGERFLLGDVVCEHCLDLDSMHTFFSPDGPVVVLPMRDGRMRLLAQVRDAPGTPLNLHPTQDELQAVIDRRIGGIRIVHSHWLTSFEIHHARVPALRWGRVFLAGDAAHIHSPAGGQGMNTGIQDAFNLAWKLAAVVNGDAGDALLDSYEAERLPVAEQVITFTDRLTKAGTLSGLPRRIRDTVIRILSHVPTRGTDHGRKRRRGQHQLPEEPDRRGFAPPARQSGWWSNTSHTSQTRSCTSNCATRAARTTPATSYSPVTFGPPSGWPLPPAAPVRRRFWSPLTTPRSRATKPSSPIRKVLWHSGSDSRTVVGS